MHLCLASNRRTISCHALFGRWRRPGDVADPSTQLGSNVGSSVGCDSNGGSCPVQSRPRNTQSWCWRRACLSWPWSQPAPWQRPLRERPRRTRQCRTRVRRTRWCWRTEAAMQAARKRCVSARCSVAWTPLDTRPGRSTGALARGPSRRWTCSRALTVCASTASPVRSRSRPCVRDRTCCSQERVTQAPGLARSVRCSVGCAATGTRQDRSTVDTDRGRSGR